MAEAASISPPVLAAEVAVAARVQTAKAELETVAPTEMMAAQAEMPVAPALAETDMAGTMAAQVVAGAAQVVAAAVRVETAAGTDLAETLVAPVGTTLETETVVARVETALAATDPAEAAVAQPGPTADPVEADPLEVARPEEEHVSHSQYCG